ncbi:MAG TPA: hypothetical protein VFL66_01195 [Gaiellaceae bacterium]|nr:hypothetical protein [Gaiellaceae bacterium]
MNVSELPPPLPPATRTVGQLVAESIRFYQSRFWAVLALGLAIALLDLIPAHGYGVHAAVLCVGAPVLTAAFIAATALVSGVRPTRRSGLTALAAGTVVFLPAAALSGWFDLLAVAWLAFLGLVVPVALVEQTGFRDSLVRARRLATADYVHALGSLAALAIVYFIVRQALVVLLKTQGDAAERIASFLADLVLSPLLFVGAVQLYYDQAARIGLRKPVAAARAD